MQRHGASQQMACVYGVTTVSSAGRAVPVNSAWQQVSNSGAWLLNMDQTATPLVDRASSTMTGGESGDITTASHAQGHTILSLCGQRMNTKDAIALRAASSYHNSIAAQPFAREIGAL